MDEKIKSNVLTDKSKTILIIPFVYQQNYYTIGNGLEEAGWELGTLREQKNIVEHVSNLIASKSTPISNETIGKYYTLKKDNREQYGLPKNASQKLYLISEQEEWTSFKVEKVAVYLFETKVGFLTFDIKHISQDVDEVVLTNYKLKHLHHLYSSLLYSQKEYFMLYKQKKLTRQELSPSLRTLAAMTDSLLEPLQVTSYFSNQRTPETALVYNFVLFDQAFKDESNWEQKLGRILFELRRSYKKSYKPSPIEYEIKQNPFTIQLFENSYWGTSLEGIVNIAYLTDDEVTDRFFLGNYSSNLESSYFYLYMLALHQRYAFLNLNALAAKLPKTTDEQETVQQEEGRIKIAELRKEINFVILRSFFKHVSSVTHQQSLYEVIAKNLHLEELKEDIHFELEALASIAELEENKRREERREAKKREDKEEAIRREQERDAEQKRRERERDEDQNRREKNADMFLLVSTIFVIISTATSSWPILMDLFDRGSIETINFPAPYAFIILIFVFSLIGLYGYKFVKDKWRK